jgi:hypothetical protein
MATVNKEKTNENVPCKKEQQFETWGCPRSGIPALTAMPLPAATRSSLRRHVRPIARLADADENLARHRL